MLHDVFARLVAPFFLISHGANAIIAFILVITTLRLYKKTGIRLVILMSVLMTSWMLTNSLLIVPLLFGGIEVGSSAVTLIASWNIIGSAIVPSVFIIFIDAFEGEIDPKKVSVAFATIVASFFIALMGLTSGDVSLSSTIVEVEGVITMRWSPVSSLAIFPTVIACGVWTQRELKSSSQHIIDEKQKNQIKFMRLGGILMFYVGPVFGIAGVIAVDGFNQEVLATYLSEIIGYLFVSVGIIMITLAYTTSDAIAFLQPQRIDSIITMFSTGIPVFQYDFSPKEEDRTDVSLISGAITAIKAIMAEAFNVQSEVKQIAFHDKELLLDFEEFGNDVGIAYVLITDRKSSFLETALSRFAKEFTEFVPHDAVNGIQLNQDELDQAVKILRKSFGLSSIEE